MRWTLVLRLALPVLLVAAVAIAQPPPPPPLTPLPPPPQPAGNPVTPAKVNLGKTLFWDEQLSATRTVACGSCHQATRGGSDPRTVPGSARALNPGADGIAGTADDILGSPGVILNDASGAFGWSTLFGMAEQVTGRLAPAFLNAAYAPELLWDGRAGQTFLDPETGATVLQAGGALENQASGPPVSSAEMGHVGRSWTDVAARVAGATPLMLASHVPAALNAWIGARRYPDLFREAFGSEAVTAARIVMAIASYERTLVTNQTPFDSVIAGTAALGPQEAQGMQLFGALGCAGCHAGALMSDQRYHYIGVRPAAEDVGREAVSGDPADRGAFRTPSLRNVALRPAYMHDGRFATLEEVVDFYNRGGDFTAPNKPAAIRPLNLNLGQRAALLAFLRRPLTDPRVAAGAEPFDRPTLYTETSLVPQTLAGGLAGASGVPPAAVAIEPAVTGNPQFTVGVHGGPAGAPAVLVVDDQEPAAAGGIPASGSFGRFETLLALGSNGDGYGSATFAIPDDAALEGRTLFGRWYVSDPAASGGVAASPAFRFTIFGAHGTTPVLATPPAVIPAPALRLAAAGANPFHDVTRVRFELASPSPARLAVYDLNGRAVRLLYDRDPAPAGPTTVAWDGRDDGGHQLPGGVYFYRLDTTAGARTARVVRLP